MNKKPQQIDQESGTIMPKDSEKERWGYSKKRVEGSEIGKSSTRENIVSKKEEKRSKDKGRVGEDIEVGNSDTENRRDYCLKDGGGQSCFDRKPRKYWQML